MKKLAIAAAIALAYSGAGAQTADLTFYTDSGSNFGNTGFVMPTDPTGAVPGTYAETIAFPYMYSPIQGQQPGVSNITLSSSNTTSGRYVVRYTQSRILTTPQLVTVTPVYVLQLSLDPNGNLLYAQSGTAYNAGSLVQYDQNYDIIDQNGNSAVRWGTLGYGNCGANGAGCAVGTPYFYCATNYDGASNVFYQGCATGYMGNVVDDAHQTQFPQYGNQQQALDVNGLSVGFTCTRTTTRFPTDVCTLATFQADGTQVGGAVLPSAEYWIVLPYDTSYYKVGTTTGSAGGYIFSRTALGAPPHCPSGTTLSGNQCVASSGGSDD